MVPRKESVAAEHGRDLHAMNHPAIKRCSSGTESADSDFCKLWGELTDFCPSSGVKGRRTRLTKQSVLR
jgi:hypothetical protein